MKVIRWIGIVLNLLALLLIELAIFVNNPWEILNPFLQFKVAYYWIISPVVWVGMALILISSIPRHRR